MPLSTPQNHSTITNKHPDLTKYLTKLERESPFYPMAAPQEPKSASNDRNKSMASDDSASIMTSSSASSTTKLLKAKFTPSSKSSKPEDTRSPREKQLARKAGRMDPVVLAEWAALR